MKIRKAGGSIIRATLPGVSFTVCGDARQPPPTFAPYRNKLHPLRGRSSARIWQSRAVEARKAHNLEVAGPSPASATTGAVSPVTLSTAASAAMQAAVPTQGGHLRGEVGTLSLHQCGSTTFSKIFFRVREPELPLGLICTQSYERLLHKRTVEKQTRCNTEPGRIYVPEMQEIRKAARSNYRTSHQTL